MQVGKLQKCNFWIYLNPSAIKSCIWSLPWHLCITLLRLAQFWHRAVVVGGPGWELTGGRVLGVFFGDCLTDSAHCTAGHIWKREWEGMRGRGVPSWISFGHLEKCVTLKDLLMHTHTFHLSYLH